MSQDYQPENHPLWGCSRMAVRAFALPNSGQAASAIQIEVFAGFSDLEDLL